MRDSPTAQDKASAGPQRPGVGRILALLAVGILLFGLLYLTPLKHSLGHPKDIPRTISDSTHRLGWAAPAAYVALSALLIAVGAPRLLLCAAGGLAFGFWRGLLWSQIATVLGSYACFLFVRWAGRDYVLGRWPWLNRHESLLTHHGILTVLLAKQLPISALGVNSLLALTRLAHSHFIIGTVIGSLPQAIPVTLASASASQDSLPRLIGYIGLAVALMAVGAMILKRSLPRTAQATSVGTAVSATSAGRPVSGPRQSETHP